MLCAFFSFCPLQSPSVPLFFTSSPSLLLPWLQLSPRQAVGPCRNRRSPTSETNLHKLQQSWQDALAGKIQQQRDGPTAGGWTYLPQCLCACVWEKERENTPPRYPLIRWRDSKYLWQAVQFSVCWGTLTHLSESVNTGKSKVQSMRWCSALVNGIQHPPQGSQQACPVSFLQGVSSCISDRLHWRILLCSLNEMLEACFLLLGRANLLGLTPPSFFPFSI